jgi:tetratricopeptide (TPR) repeat protein
VRDSIAMENPSPVTYPITIHEYVHLVIRHSGLRIPLWLNEGWAEVYSTLKPVKDGVAVGDLIPNHMAILEKGTWFSLNELEAIDNRSRDYNESTRAGMFYAEGWALTHMLYLSPEYKANFGKFIGVLNKGRGLDEALQTAFGRSPDQVLADLRNYFLRKNLYGTVFLTPFEKSGEAPVVSAPAPYETELMKADLYAASGHLSDATRTYRQLQTDNPQRPEAFEGAGYLGVITHDKDEARLEFAKAFALGTNDAQLCMQLAVFDRDAKQPPDTIMAVLERAVKLRPDFAEAAFELGIMKLERRDFEAVVSLLGRVPAVAPERVAIFNSALAYSNLQLGNIAEARSHGEAARKAAVAPADIQASDRLLSLIEARSKGVAIAKPGEKLLRAEGTALGLRCAVPGSGLPSKIGITVAGAAMLFDMPEPAAVEIVRHPEAGVELKCGPLPPFRVAIEYAASGAVNTAIAKPDAGATVIDQPPAGMIRRLEF